MRIKRFKLRDGVTEEKLIKYGCKQGGTWVTENAILFTRKWDKFKPTHFEFTIYVTFNKDVQDWNDYDNVLILDEDFCQPYEPFYLHYNEEVENFPTLEYLVEKYNEYMSSLPFLVETEVTDNGQ